MHSELNWRLTIKDWRCEMIANRDHLYFDICLETANLEQPSSLWFQRPGSAQLQRRADLVHRAESASGGLAEIDDTLNWPSGRANN